MVRPAVWGGAVRGERAVGLEVAMTLWTLGEEKEEREVCVCVCVWGGGGGGGGGGMGKFYTIY